MSDPIIQGIVREPGVAGARGADPQWYAVLILLPWRNPDGQIVRTTLRLQMPVDHSELEEWRQKIPIGMPIEIEVESVVDNEVPSRMVAFRGAVVDRELDRVAAEIAHKPPIEDPILGTLTYDAAKDCYATELDWGSDSIELTIELVESGSLDEEFDTARKLWTARDRWLDDVRQHLISELLGLKNTTWLEDGEAAVSEDQFLNKITLESLSIDGGGQFTFWFDDGDLFWRHSIEVRGNLREGITEVTLAG